MGSSTSISVSKPGLAIVTAQFKVGVPRTEALVRLYDTINANRDWLPKELSVGEPIDQAQGHRRRADRHADAVDGRRRRAARSSSSASRTRWRSS